MNAEKRPHRHLEVEPFPHRLLKILHDKAVLYTIAVKKHRRLYKNIHNEKFRTFMFTES
jgi:hypothetical protein